MFDYLYGNPQAERARASAAEWPDDGIPRDQQATGEHQAGRLQQQQQQQGWGGREQQQRQQTNSSLLCFHCCSLSQITSWGEGQAALALLATTIFYLHFVNYTNIPVKFCSSVIFSVEKLIRFIYCRSKIVQSSSRCCGPCDFCVHLSLLLEKLSATEK